MQGIQNYINQSKQPYLYTPLLKAGDVSRDLSENYFSILPSLLTLSETFSNEWEEFKKSWENLLPDNFMKDNGKYRRRRYSVFSWHAATRQLVIEPKQAHYQEVNYNSLNGGVQREFETFENHIIHNNIFNKVMSFCILVLEHLHRNQDWHIEAHQFRITAQKAMTGLPTPEGIHRDGRHYVMMMFIDKNGIKGGKTTLYDLNKTKLTTHTLNQPAETIFVNDEMLMHEVSPIEPMDSYGTRDVLVITFYKKPNTYFAKETLN